MKPRIRISIYTSDKGTSVSFQEQLPGGKWSNYFWNIDSYFNWFYIEQHLM